MAARLRLRVTGGPLAGKIFDIPRDGLRAGRRSACEISLPDDPAVSRNHCLFELRDGAAYMVDLGSANGTEVNGRPEAEKALAPGDRIVIGGTEITVEPDAPAPNAPPPPPVPPPPRPETVDLGFGKRGPAKPGAGEEDEAPQKKPARAAVLAAAALALAAAVAMILLVPPDDGRGEKIRQAADNGAAAGAGRFEFLSFEHVEAGKDGIARRLLEVDAAGTLKLAIDEVPDANRHLNETKKRETAMFDSLEKALVQGELDGFPPESRGPDRPDGEVSSHRLRWKCGGAWHDIYFENCELPLAVAEFCRRLEVFANDEFHSWPLQYSAAQLIEKAGEERRNGDVKWADRYVEPGNAFAAMQHYDRAIAYLKTVDRKPAFYGELLESRKKAHDEVERRWRELKRRVDIAENARNTADAEAALEEIRRVIPDPTHPHHAEAAERLFSLHAKTHSKGARR